MSSPEPSLSVIRDPKVYLVGRQSVNDQALAEFLLGMRHDDQIGSIRMLEHMMRSPDSTQLPTGLAQQPDKLRTSHRAHHTH